ncbi:uncharacterized protein LY89DRAFT_702889 [Mollisia scopiformis]|uniref:Uncharacterized protein n=1 Tax=Mollisia scopiformis TaxID=149040 RepID=A0A132B2L6_MOLSC|nr:uncharacterized protein LY89DRAFT_702889 [Mollisia scopiformis]KUJ06571.1 hypothetical protein LY89DRAFT_702889 [Mollisia scopiformis]
MATTETAQQMHESPSKLTEMPDRPGRRRPFSSWMKKLANFKAGSSADSGSPASTKRNTYQMRSNGKKPSPSKNNNPYPQSGVMNGNDFTAPNGHRSFSTVPTGTSMSTTSLDRSRRSFRSSLDGLPPPTIGNKSMAATSSTDHDAAHSDAAPSHAPSSGQGTNATAGCGVSSGRGADSTFSSPAHSVRSLTTTLTTIQSVAPQAATGTHHNSNTNNSQSIQFVHQFPTSPPPNALPAHLVPQGSGGHPATYNTATANNLLTDNASILTLASSSKRRRRRSMDTDASVRALAPSSLFGGSRESLPLSVLSANIDPSGPPHQTRPSVGGLNERASIYSATGVAPALPSERNSYYAGKQSMAADGSSIKSGLLGHGRNDSISGSIGGVVAPGSPLASPRDLTAQNGKLSRTNSAWGEGGEGGKNDSADAEADGEYLKEAEKS